MTMGAGFEPNAHWNKKGIAAPRGNIGLAADRKMRAARLRKPIWRQFILILTTFVDIITKRLIARHRPCSPPQRGRKRVYADSTHERLASRKTLPWDVP